LARLVPSDAEQVWTISFLLELPYSIRIEDARFLVSADAEAWEGWSQEAMGALAGMPRLPDGVRPTHSIEIKQAEVLTGAPHQAGRKTFHTWAAATKEKRGFGPGNEEPETTSELRSVVRVSMFYSADVVLEEVGDEMLEWTARRFDDAIELTNQYLVVLAAMHDEWHISSLSRTDLPRELPYTLRLDPGPPDGPYEVNGSMDIYTWFKDDVPPVRPMEEVQAAATIVRETHLGRIPFFNWIELYQAAEHHLGSGRYMQSVISATTGIEVLINTIFRVAGAVGAWNSQETSKALSAPFRQQLEHHLPKLLNEQLELGDADLPPGRWHQLCYGLRNNVVHEGKKPTPAEGLDAKLATGEFARWIGAAMVDDARLAWVKEFLQARPVQ
jgi:hypothetical protein